MDRQAQNSSFPVSPATNPSRTEIITLPVFQVVQSTLPGLSCTRASHVCTAQLTCQFYEPVGKEGFSVVFILFLLMWATEFVKQYLSPDFLLYCSLCFLRVTLTDKTDKAAQGCRLFQVK